MCITSKRTFTLIEVLIAVTIITLIILSVYSAFTTGILVYKKIDSSLDIYQEARITLSRLETDLKNSFSYSEEASLFKGEVSALDFFSVCDGYDGDERHSDLCRIKYEVEGDTLKRFAHKGIAALTEGETLKAQDFSERIKDINFEYAYPGEGADANIIWQNNWPQKEEQVKGLPLAVRIKLVLLDSGTKQQKLAEFTKTIGLVQGRVPAAKEK